jgi:predicted nuclease of predicted toxin-antitoxin system
VIRLLADENIPLETIRALRSDGHDVFSASESAQGASDNAHIARAIEEDRLILTFDLDFGLLAATAFPKPTAGVLLLRLAPQNPDEVTTLVQALLARPEIVWRRQLSIADRVHLRQRPL